MDILYQAGCHKNNLCYTKWVCLQFVHFTFNIINILVISAVVFAAIIDVNKDGMSSAFHPTHINKTISFNATICFS